MRQLDFGNGRIFNYCFDRNDKDSDESLKKHILRMYPYINAKNYHLYCEEMGIDYLTSDLEEEVLVECLFKDVEEYGEEKILKAIDHFEMIVAYSSEGLACPGGPIDWD